MREGQFWLLLLLSKDLICCRHFLRIKSTGFRLYFWSQLCCNDNTRKYGEWVIVTGATDGIGQSMAKDFARRGHSIIVVGRNDEKLARTKTMLESEPNVGQVETIKIDLSDSSIENYERITAQLNADNRDIGILVNNAGVFCDTFQRFAKFDLQTYHDLINVNILATVYFTRLILPGMVDRQRGLVLNVSSILGSVPTPYMALYGVTKTFINRFSRTLEIEYSNIIDIINLEPGAVHTKLFTQTAKMAKPTIFNPSSDDYAATTLNAISTRISSINGTCAHAANGIIIKLCDNLGLLPFLFRMNIRFNAKNHSLSPVLKRKTPGRSTGQNPPIEGGEHLETNPV